MRNIVISFIFFIMAAVSAHAKPYIDKHVPNAEIVGQGQLDYLFWNIYQATLYAPQKHWSWNTRFALSLDYLRALDGEAIAKRSVKEMRGLGFDDEVRLATWYTAMKEIFPDVDKGIRLTGIYKPNQPTIFYKHDQQIGVVQDPEFGKWFFGIWLSEETSEPGLRKELLGLK